MQAAKAAGMRCIVTKSRYTEGESFNSADAIFDCIGDAGDERFSLEDACTPGTDIISTIDHLQNLHSFPESCAVTKLVGGCGSLLECYEHTSYDVGNVRILQGEVKH